LFRRVVENPKPHELIVMETWNSREDGMARNPNSETRIPVGSPKPETRIPE
jgi:hypothetical protein